MKVKAEGIADILADYENNNMTTEHVLEWVHQFDIADQEFILDELLHIFQRTYLSKTRCRQLLTSYIKYWAKEFKYDNIPSLISETIFLDLQPPHKSQKELLDLLDEILIESYGCNLAQSGQKAKRYIYLDDVLSTGGTIYRNLNDWLHSTSDIATTKTNYYFLKDNHLKLHIYLLCGHTWGTNNVEYRLIKSIGENIKKIVDTKAYYWIENNIKDYNPKLNNMVPLDRHDPYVHEYWNSLVAIDKANHAFRPTHSPTEEKLFSSPASRNRLETLFLVKGIEILSRVGELKVKQIRPLGYTVKSHKTFGLGTLFFTYRNIPNNCPLVFWWGSNNWKPLFVLKNRGV